MTTSALTVAGRQTRVVLALLAIACSAALGILFDVVPRLQAMTLGTVFVGFCVAVLAVEAFGRERRDMFSPLSLLIAYHAIGFGVKGLFDLASGQSRIGRALDPSSVQFADLMLLVFSYALIGMISLIVGDRIARRHEGRKPLQAPAPELKAIPLWQAVSAGTCLTILGVSVLIARFGSMVFTDPSYIAVEGTFGLFWLYPLMHASVYGYALAIANRWAARKRVKLWLIGAIAVTSVAVYAVTSSKAILIIAVMLIVLTYHRAVRPPRLSVLFGLAAAFLVALPLLYLHREYGFTAESLSRVTPGMALAGAQIFLGRSYLADSFGAVLLYTPRVFPYRLGATWLELFYFWIPRSIWPSKPLSSSLAFGHTYLSSFFERQSAYYSPTLIGDAYLNLGPVGIVLVFGVIGYLLRRWYHWSYGPRARPETIVLYAISAYWIGMGAEQSLATFVGLAASYVGVGFLLAAIARRGLPVHI